MKERYMPNNMTLGTLRTIDSWNATEVKKLDAFLLGLWSAYWNTPGSSKKPYGEKVLKMLGDVLVKISRIVVKSNTFSDCVGPAAKLEFSMRGKLASLMVLPRPVSPEPSLTAVEIATESAATDKAVAATAESLQFPLTFHAGKMKNDLAARCYAQGIGPAGKVKIKVHNIVDEFAMAEAERVKLAEPKISGLVQLDQDADLPEQVKIYFPVGTVGDVIGIHANRLKITVYVKSEPVTVFLKLEDVEPFVAKPAEKTGQKRKHDEVAVVVEPVPDGFPFAVASPEQALQMMLQVAPIILYSLNSKVKHVRMLRDPDRCFVAVALAAKTLTLIPFSTDIVTKKDNKKKNKATEQVSIRMTIEGVDFKKTAVKFWVNPFDVSGEENLESNPPVYAAVSPFWFLRGIDRDPAPGGKEVRLIETTHAVDCNLALSATGLLKPLGGRKVKIVMHVPVYTNAEALTPGDMVFRPSNDKDPEKQDDEDTNTVEG